MKNLLLVLFTATVFAVSGQNKNTVAPAKKPLTHAAYDEWKSITYKAISNDGNYMAHTLNPEDGDGKLVLLNTKTNSRNEVQRADKIQITWDSKFAVFTIKPQKDTIVALRRLKKKKDDWPKDTLGIFDLATKKITKIPDVRSFKAPEKAGGWLAYQLEAKKETKEKKSEQDTAKMDQPKPKNAKKVSDENGYHLVLRNLATGEERTFAYVKQYFFAKFGQGLLLHTTGSDSTWLPGVYWYGLGADAPVRLHEAHTKHKITHLTIDEVGSQVAFIVDADTTKALIRSPKLYHWAVGSSSATVLAEAGMNGMPAEWYVSEHFNPYFAKDGSKLYYGTSPAPVVQDTTKLDEEMVKVEVWHWQDDYIYPEQNVRADRDRKRSYLAVAHLPNRKLVQLASTDLQSIETGDEGNAPIALGTDDRQYRMARTWDVSAFQDIYLVDMETGQRKPIAKAVKGNARLSPAAKYVYWFSYPDTAWFAHHIANGTTVKLTAHIKVSFADEQDDHPDYPGPYGLAGWTANDDKVLLYDRYDIWQLDPSGTLPPKNLTASGRSSNTVFRYVNLDREERFIDPAGMLLLSAFNEVSKAAGYYKLAMSSSSLSKLMMTDHRYGGMVKAKDAPTLLYTRESYREFPDLYLADLDFKATKKMSTANPQQQNYNWGTVELVKWTSLDNIPLEGLLYKPEGFDPTKKYPMIVYFYERNADNLHQHWKPEPIRSAVHRTMYTSNGYLVFVPDIVYKDGFPGESAHNCILPGVTHLIARGFVDTDNIGIQGHSWGGYQTAYLLTRTNMFKAAEAGAIVANMTSAYGGIRWGSGLARMFQYEKSQSRIGGTLWEKPLHYIENSPLFMADRIQTPLLLLHNDADDAVPWYQGIEMYLAMRRLDKPCWMLNYNGEPHWPVKRENRIDFQTRMMQFFDHYLKGAPMPQWMQRGVPAIEKGINQGLELMGN